MRVGHKVHSDPIVIWYNNNPKRRCWMINNRSQLRSDNAKCVIKSQADRIEAVSEGGKKWKEFNQE